jgi:hypothetical protein
MIGAGGEAEEARTAFSQYGRDAMESIQQLAAQADAALQQISAEDVAAVAGGTTADCPTGTPTTVTVNTGVFTVETKAPDFASAVINLYEGIVQSTSYVIERVLTPLTTADEP